MLNLVADDALHSNVCDFRDVQHIGVNDLSINRG